MNTLETKIDLLVKLAISENENEQRALRSKLLDLVTADRTCVSADKMSSNYVDDCIDTILSQIGCPANLLGYDYLKCALVLTISDPKLSHNITTELYPLVAEACSSTPTRVERSIRHAIECAWRRGSPAVFHSYFGNSIDHKRGRPSNSEFISQVSMKLMKFLNQEV